MGVNTLHGEKSPEKVTVTNIHKPATISTNLKYLIIIYAASAFRILIIVTAISVIFNINEL